MLGVIMIIRNLLEKVQNNPSIRWALAAFVVVVAFENLSVSQYWNFLLAAIVLTVTIDALSIRKNVFTFILILSDNGHFATSSYLGFIF